MKSHARALIALLIVAFLITPSSLWSQQLPVPVEKNVFPGVTTIQYGGQTLVFTTSVTLRVKLKAVASDKILLQFKAQPRNLSSDATAGTFGGQTVVFWETAGEEIYNGAPPEGWTEIPLGEGGWTEK